TELVFRCLAAATSARGYCPRCGAPWCRVVETSFRPTQDPANGKGGRKGLDESNGQGEWPRGMTDSTTRGWRPTCACPSDLPPRPGLVLDPFAGSGRVGLQAQRMGLDFVGVELSESYCALARRLLAEAMPLFAED